jgi:putative ABC transport system permease protein
VLGPAEIGDLRRWRLFDATASTAATGLQLDVDAPGGLPNGVWVQPADVPVPLPVATAGVSGVDDLTGFDGRPVPIRAVAGLPAVPRAGAGAVLADLEYLDRYSADTGFALRPQIWLSTRAPADVVHRLEAQGLSITGDVSSALVHRQQDEQGPALSLWFHALAAVLALALAAGALVLAAVVDRGRRVEDLSALRAQGLDRGSLARATLWAYPALVLAAVPAGLAIALLTWWLTGWALPLSGLDPPPLPLPGWPRPLVVAGVGVIVVAVLAGAALAAGRRTHEEVL